MHEFHLARQLVSAALAAAPADAAIIALRVRLGPDGAAVKQALELGIQAAAAGTAAEGAAVTIGVYHAGGTVLESIEEAEGSPCV